MSHNAYAEDGALVDSDWARQHLTDPNVRFVEVDVDTTAYEQSHLPGAVGWNWTSQLADGIRRDIAGREDFSALLSASGIGPDTTVVLYGDNNNWFAPGRTGSSSCTATRLSGSSMAGASTGSTRDSH